MYRNGNLGRGDYGKRKPTIMHIFTLATALIFGAWLTLAWHIMKPIESMT